MANAEGPLLGGLVGGLVGEVTGVVDGTLKGTGLQTKDVTDLVGDLTTLGGNESLVELSVQDGLDLQVTVPESLSGVLGTQLGVSADDEGLGVALDAAVLDEVIELNTNASVLGSNGVLGANLNTSVLQETLEVDTNASVLGGSGVADVSLDTTANVAGLDPIEVGTDLAVDTDGVVLGATLPVVDAGLSLVPDDGLNVDLGLGDLGLGNDGSELEIGLGLNPGTGLDVDLGGSLGGELSELPIIPELTSPELPVTPSTDLPEAGSNGDIVADVPGFDPVLNLAPNTVEPARVTSGEAASASQRDFSTTLGESASGASKMGEHQTNLLSQGALATLAGLTPAAQQELVPVTEAERNAAPVAQRLADLWHSLTNARDGSSLGAGVGGQTLLAVASAMAALMCATVVLKPLAQGEVRLLSFTHQTLVPPG